MDDVKTKFQEFFRGEKDNEGNFKYDIFDTFWNNQELKTILFPNENDDVAGKIKFKALVEDTENSLYSFIKIK